jgi:hypothetical protein
MAGKLRNDLTGKTFGYLSVLERSIDSGNGKKPEVKWICRCICGKETVVKSYSLSSGHTKSCGCQKIKHDLSNKERLYQTWKNMRQRCNNPNRPDYSRYGRRGIRVCEEWDDYVSFRKWALENGYNDNLTIDRIEVNGNYEPSNCRWVDNFVQANNVRTNHIIEYKGKKMTMADFAKFLGMSYSTIQHRIERNWSIEKIVNTPQRTGG